MVRDTLAAAVAAPGDRNRRDVEQLDPVRRRPCPPAGHGHRLDTWIATVEADDLPELRSYTAGLKRDHEAVRNGLPLPHSSGQVKRYVNASK